MSYVVVSVIPAGVWTLMFGLIPPTSCLVMGRSGEWMMFVSALVFGIVFAWALAFRELLGRWSWFAAVGLGLVSVPISSILVSAVLLVPLFLPEGDSVLAVLGTLASRAVPVTLAVWWSVPAALLTVLLLRACARSEARTRT